MGLAAYQRGMSVGFTTAALVHEPMEARDERRLLNLQRHLCLSRTGAERLTHHVHIVEMNGASYRLKHSREKTAAQALGEPDEE